ncbi:MAG TPA: NAD-dependent epimerase/dehydratase family protein, partial [Longimicrobiales bacterium]|nr:NAD-dependent epimerase/dehydratase family protein [Longimicrobiales bacterium]
AYHNDYERTKTLADQLARRLSAEGLPLVRLYPGVVYGPGNLTSGNHVVGILLDHARGRLPGLLGNGDGLQCFAYVEDVATGVVRAVERAQPGSAYILGGDNRTTLDLFQAFHEASGIRPPRLRIPYAVAEVTGLFMRWGAELTGWEPMLTDEVARIYRREWAYSSERAVRELGYHVTPLEEGVRRTVAWLREVGRL